MAKSASLTMANDIQVSIIVPVYNSAAYLDDSIQSVISQTYDNWELLLIDDCSKDNSVAIANNYAAQDSRIRVIQHTQNTGAAIARNTGIKLAAGRFIAFLDSDDIWYEKKLEKQIAFMLDNKIAFSYTAYDKINEGDTVFETMGIPPRVNYKNLLKICVIGCLTAVYDTYQIGKAYMPTNTKREDFATWLNILKSIEYAYGLQEPLAQYRVHADQSSRKKIKMAFENWYLYRQVENLSFLQALYYFSHYAVRGTLRTNFPKIARVLGLM